MSEPFQDIGHNVEIRAVHYDGELAGFDYMHDCKGRRACSWVPVNGSAVKPRQAEGWDVVSLEPLTLSPSLLCRACGHHGFVRQGQWVSA